jgi:pimeloyl-ACP methyl ester carboxylesterase
VKIVMEAGHWVHADKPQAFQKIVFDFLEGNGA